MIDEGVIPPQIRGFLHVALLKRLSLIPWLRRRARRQAVEEFLAIRTEREAREYIEATRARVRAAKRAARRRRRPRAGPGTSER